MDKPSRELKQLTYRHHAEMKEKYGLQFLMQSDIKAPALSSIAFDYSYRGSLTVGEARLLLYHLVNDFIDRVNADQSMASKFSQFPITVENIDASITFIHENRDYLERNPSHILLLKGDISYTIYNRETKAFHFIEHERFAQ